MSEYDEKAFREACHAYGFAVHDSTPAEMIHIVMSFPTNKIIEGQRDQLATLRDTVARLEGENARLREIETAARKWARLRDQRNADEKAAIKGGRLVSWLNSPEADRLSDDTYNALEELHDAALATPERATPEALPDVRAPGESGG